jgi:hypothetical protein
MARVRLARESGGALGLRWRSPIGFHSTGSGRRGGPVVPTSRKRQAVEVVVVDRVARAKLGVIKGGL